MNHLFNITVWHQFKPKFVGTIRSNMIFQCDLFLCVFMSITTRWIHSQSVLRISKSVRFNHEKNWSTVTWPFPCWLCSLGQSVLKNNKELLYSKAFYLSVPYQLFYVKAKIKAYWACMIDSMG